MSKPTTIKSIAAATRTLAAAHNEGYIHYMEFPQPRGGFRLAIVNIVHATILAKRPLARSMYASKEALDARLKEEGAVWINT